MKISFLVTYYNQSSYVKKSLDSILAIEKPCDWEILVGDDGSMDETVSIVQEYINKYPNNIKLFVMSREHGKKYYPVLRASANRINLIEHCTGDYFCILDGDDSYCDTSFVKEALEIFQHRKDFSVVAFNYQMQYSDESVETMQLNNKTFSNVAIGRYLKKFYTPAGACVFLQGFNSTSAGVQTWERIKKTGYYDDNDIILANLNIGKLFYIDKTIYSYRQNEESTMNAMVNFEVYALNTLGYDAEMLISPHFKKYLNIRYLPAIINLWNNRKTLPVEFKKYEQYFELSEKLSNSITHKILDYKNLSFYGRIKIRIFILINMIKKPRLVISKIKKAIRGK